MWENNTYSVFIKFDCFLVLLLIIDDFCRPRSESVGEKGEHLDSKRSPSRLRAMSVIAHARPKPKPLPRRRSGSKLISTYFVLCAYIILLVYYACYRDQVYIVKHIRNMIIICILSYNVCIDFCSINTLYSIV